MTEQVTYRTEQVTHWGRDSVPGYRADLAGLFSMYPTGLMVSA